MRLIIPMIIQTIVLEPSGAIWTDDPSSVSRLNPSGAGQVDAEHPSRNRKVEVQPCWSSIKKASKKATTATKAA